MRAALILMTSLLAACATPRLALLPPAGVDLSGHWKLNAADSDDPQRLSQALSSGGGQSPAGYGGGGGQRGGRGGGRGGQSPGPVIASSGGLGQSSISTSTVAEALRWPGSDLEVKQSGGVAAFASDGDSRVYKPTGAPKKAPAKGRRASGPAVCGWSGPILVVQSEPEDGGPGFEERYQLSSGGQRLVQLVVVKSPGRANGFAMSRVWDRVQ